MAKDALFDRMEVCLGALVAVSTYILRNDRAGLFMYNFVSRYRGATNGAFMVQRFYTGQAQSHQEACPVIYPVPCDGNNHKGKKKHQHVGLRDTYARKFCAQLCRV